MRSKITARRLMEAPPPRVLIDAGIAAVVLAASLAILGHGIGTPHPRSTPDLAGAMLTAAATVPLVAWRRAPFGVFVVTGAASAAASALGYALFIPLGPTAALYLLAASRDQTHRWTPRTTAAAAGLFVVYLAASAAADRGFPWNELFHSGLAWALAWFGGDRTRLLRAQTAELRERAVRAEVEAERERRLAVAEERARIARDLHDSAGHAISVIAVRAGAARMRHGRDPDRLLLALTAVEELARQTAEEIDQIVSTLREGGSEEGGIEAPARLASLDTLVAHHAAAGLEVLVERRGAQRPLVGAADQAAYRILQEALTNVARHGSGNARVDLAFGQTAVDITVTNPLPLEGAPHRSGGHGLIGMRERATLVGGSLDAERVDGAFHVHARIPYRGHRG